MSWILLYKSIVEAKYCDRFTRWLSSFISHQIQCNMPTRGIAAEGETEGAGEKGKKWERKNEKMDQK